MPHNPDPRQVQGGKLGAARSAVTVAKLAKLPARPRLYEVCRVCGKAKILVVDGVCVGCR